MQRTCDTVSFKALVGTHLANALCDNLFKIVVSFYAIMVLPSAVTATKFISFISILFILPFIVFSFFGGYLADRFRKKDVIVVLFGIKILMMLSATWSLYRGDLFLLCIMVAFFEVDTALYVPARLGLLAEILNDEELSKGNGYMQMASFLGIILGTSLGGVLFEQCQQQLYLVGVLMTVVMTLTFIASHWIKGGREERGPVVRDMFAEFVCAFRGIVGNRSLVLMMLVLAFFNFIGSVFHMNILVWASYLLHARDTQISFLLLFICLGLSLGSIWAGLASDKKIDLGLVPLGGVGIALSALLLGYNNNYFLCAGLLSFLGICGGFFSVPPNAFFQYHSPEAHRGMYLSILGIVTAVGYFLAGGFLWLLGGKFGVKPDMIFIICSGLCLAITALILIMIDKGGEHV